MYALKAYFRGLIFVVFPEHVIIVAAVAVDELVVARPTTPNKVITGYKRRTWYACLCTVSLLFECQIFVS